MVNDVIHEFRAGRIRSIHELRTGVDIWWTTPGGSGLGARRWTGASRVPRRAGAGLPGVICSEARVGQISAIPASQHRCRRPWRGGLSLYGENPGLDGRLDRSARLAGGHPCHRAHGFERGRLTRHRRFRPRGLRSHPMGPLMPRRSTYGDRPGADRCREPSGAGSLADVADGMPQYAISRRGRTSRSSGGARWQRPGARSSGRRARPRERRPARRARHRTPRSAAARGDRARSR